MHYWDFILGIEIHMRRISDDLLQAGIGSSTKQVEVDVMVGEPLSLRGDAISWVRSVLAPTHRGQRPILGEADSYAITYHSARQRIEDLSLFYHPCNERLEEDVSRISGHTHNSTMKPTRDEAPHDHKPKGYMLRSM